MSGKTKIPVATPAAMLKAMLRGVTRISAFTGPPVEESSIAELAVELVVVELGNGEGGRSPFQARRGAVEPMSLKKPLKAKKAT
ncbi:hypothetical protein PM037_18065 [Halorubrum ezzemoulense]|nr:hypothetical protein [Halorubrum ezzemoulense]